MTNSQPISVLRKSGSFASLQQQKSSDQAYDPLSVKTPPRNSSKVTIVNTTHLPKYSTERYYMLSEVQLKAHSILFLQDLFPDTDDDDTDPTVESSTFSMDVEIDLEHAHDHEETSNTPNLPPYTILYLFWRPDSEYFGSAALYAKHVIQPAIQKIQRLHKASQTPDDGNVSDHGPAHAHAQPQIYLAVDRLAPTNSSMDANQLASYRKEQIAITEELIRVVATATTDEHHEEDKTHDSLEAEEMMSMSTYDTSHTKLRSHIDGMTIGLSSDFRAAPGIETCMDAILVGDAERRLFPQNRRKHSSMTIIRNGRELDPSRSCIGIVTEYPDDLTGIDPIGETDAVQNLSLHARSVGNWSGKGNVLNFGARSQKFWRQLWDFSAAIQSSGDDTTLRNVGNSYSIMSRRRKRDWVNNPQVKYLPSEDMRQRTERKADLMVLGFVSFISALLWQQYSEQICWVIRGMVTIGQFLLDELRRH